jgi:hypothetical protein
MAEVDVGVRAAAGATSGSAEGSLAPHLEQKLVGGVLAWPQDGQCGESAAPQRLQNLLSSGTVARQLGHCIPHLNRRGGSAYHQRDAQRTRVARWLSSAATTLAQRLGTLAGARIWSGAPLEGPQN